MTDRDTPVTAHWHDRYTHTHDDDKGNSYTHTHDIRGSGDVWDDLDRVLPHYPEDDDDLAELRRLVNLRRDAPEGAAKMNDWQDTARLYAQNADYWRGRAERLRQAAVRLLETLDEDDGPWWWQADAERLRTIAAPTTEAPPKDARLLGLRLADAVLTYQRGTVIEGLAREYRLAALASSDDVAVPTWDEAHDADMTSDMRRSETY
jgi:hypothetical protein